MKETYIQFESYITDNMAQCDREIESLNKDFRNDEADIVKIRKNIFDIFLKMFRMAMANGKDDKEVKAWFLKRVEVIPANWKSSLVAARAHNDTRKILEEETKLKAIEEIEAEFRRRI